MKCANTRLRPPVGLLEKYKVSPDMFEGPTNSGPEHCGRNVRALLLAETTGSRRGVGWTSYKQKTKKTSSALIAMKGF